MSIDAEWVGDAGRKNTSIMLTLGALPLTESHLVYQVGKQIGRSKISWTSL
jgi:hypothetical protein